MPLVHDCATDGCDILTMGEYCRDCETAELHRDRPDLLKTMQGHSSHAGRTQSALPAA